MGGRRLHYIHDQHIKHGPIIRISPHEVAISDLEAVQEIHQVNSGFLKAQWYMLLNNNPYPGVFAEIDPKKHTERRRLLGSGFARSNILRWEGFVRAEIDLAVQKMGEEAQKEGKFDMLKWWTFLATDVISELNFGSSVRMLEQGQKNQYMVDIETSIMLGSLMAEIPRLISLLSWLPIPQIRRIEKAALDHQNHGYQAVQRRKRMALAGELNTDRTGIFDKMFAAGEKQAISDDDIGAEAGNLVVAGSDTTAVTLTYLVWATLKHFNIHTKVLQEVQKVSEPLTSEKILQLPYLDAVIQETLRLFGAAPGGLPRTVPACGKTLAGYFIPGGITATTQAYTLHRDPEIFSDPGRFWPERWMAPHCTQRMEAAKMAFSVGSRKCLGIHLAMMELQLASATFFKRFPNARVLETFSDTEMEMENFFLIQPKGHRCLIRVSP